MLYSIYAKNYKSIKEIQVRVGTFNILIGENGAGKSNILEALASYSAIIENSFTNEFMLSRGIRVTESQNLFSCFSNKEAKKAVIGITDTNTFGCRVTIKSSDEPFAPLQHEIQLFSPKFNDEDEIDFETFDLKDLTINLLAEKYEDLWKKYGSFENFSQKLDLITEELDKLNSLKKEKDITPSKEFKNEIMEYKKFRDEVSRINVSVQALNKIMKITENYNEINKEHKNIKNFIIFSPELSSLRVFSSDSQIEPLGVNGEGLLKLLQVMQEHEPENFKKVCETVEMFQWVEKIIIDNDIKNTEQRIKIIDRFMGREIDHRSANEGFLFVLFYAALFTSKFTPQSFAVDNIDASLNPKLCRVLIKELISLAKENGKQAFVTTHNPAILDGLDLHDNEQRLFVVERDDEGATQLRRVGVDDLPKPTRSGQSIKLSESFMRGFLGGLPTNF
ncbi:ATP-binding protein [Acinetobacter sp. AOR15_HL]|uniref:AAA family ATPase n=1 Tax=unclassified Acinetobacter TaxID=196816 RepID=UPI0022EB5779|nr:MULTISPECIES: AAA family ATPase [unclassified Acinetobacter]MDA3557123.1 ATP-binding protein [Acinetobacter sp. AOR15_HL]MDA3572732.1 ATP-binding protein [Acinetobacter sp. AOR14_HL]